MDLRNGAVDAPADAHLAPVEDELLLVWAQFRHIVSFVSVWTEITELSVACQESFELTEGWVGYPQLSAGIASDPSRSETHSHQRSHGLEPQASRYFHREIIV